MTEPTTMHISAGLLASMKADIYRLKTVNAELVDTTENLIIAIGMGWDLDGVIEACQTALHKAGSEAQS